MEFGTEGTVWADLTKYGLLLEQHLSCLQISSNNSDHNSFYSFIPSIKTNESATSGNMHVCLTMQAFPIMPIHPLSFTSITQALS